MQHLTDDFPEPPRLPPARNVLVVDAGLAPTERALRVAIDRAFGAQRIAKRHWAAAHGMDGTAVARALDASRAGGPYLARVAMALGYVPHPSMSGHYRRRDVVDPVAPDLADDEDMDPETQAMIEHARLEREDHDASRCESEDDDRGDGWLDSPDGQAVLSEARMDAWLDAWQSEQDAVWARYSELVPFDELKGFEDAETEENA